MHNIRPTKVEIDLDALSHNLSVVERLKEEGCKVLGVVKANAYGHGAVIIAKELINLGIDMLGVAIAEEAIELRKNGIDSPILILAGLLEEQVEDIIDYNLTQTVYTLSLAKALSEIAIKKNKQVRVHVKVDTGMGRIGIAADQVLDFINTLNTFPNLVIEGIFTHLAVADKNNEENKKYTLKQLETFKIINKKLEEKGINIPLKHAANSATIIDYPEDYFNMIRPGLMLYGAYPSPLPRSKVVLKPVMSFKTKIIYLKDVSADKSISYGRAFFTKRKSKIATIPVGYDDGYNRLLSNKAEVLIHGKRAPIVGTICMDMCMIDVTDIEDVGIGDEVILFGQDQGQEITVDEIATKLNTISYEVLCCIGRRVPRVYKKGEKVVEVVDYLDYPT